jgi:plasmid stabilization system protein ParE
MSYKIVILASAEQDMKELRSYIIKNFSLATWQDTYNKLKDTIRSLKDFPFAGAIPEELERLNLTQFRQVISGMNRVIYEVRQEIIYIHIIADTRKDMKTLLTQRLLRSD